MKKALRAEKLPSVRGGNKEDLLANDPNAKGLKRKKYRNKAKPNSLCRKGQDLKTCCPVPFRSASREKRGFLNRLVTEKSLRFLVAGRGKVAEAQSGDEKREFSRWGRRRKREGRA